MHCRIFAFLLVLWSCTPLVVSAQGQVTGRVFEDANRNLTRDPGEPGIPSVLVSNQRDIVETDERGRYALPLLGNGTTVFVIKPPDFELPVNESMLPQFYYVHQSDGSPPLRYGGLGPTGELPGVVDFPLFRAATTGAFDVLVFADPQPRDHRELDYIRDDVVSDLAGNDAAFGLVLGDIMYDDLSLFDRYISLFGSIGIPFFNVPGNHDMDFDAPDDRNALDTFKRHFGPTYYAFEYGRVSFVVLDVVEWLGGFARWGTGNYRGKIGERQLEWIRSYLEYVPADRLVVFAMHIPLDDSRSNRSTVNILDRRQLFSLVRDRRHLLALAGHMHLVDHVYLDQESGWFGRQPFHQIVCATVSGSWWSGPLDERGVPVTDHRDGTPNGYHVVSFDGTDYSEVFRAAGEPADLQMRIFVPADVTSRTVDTAVITVNVFNGGERSVVTCQIDNRPPHEMTRVLKLDPYVTALHVDFRGSFPYWIVPQLCSHLWEAPLPEGLGPGLHTVRVETTDQYGRVYESTAVFEID